MKMKRFFTSCFGLGRLPWAPGTWACVPVAVLFGILKYIGASGSAVAAFMSLMVVFGAVVCLRFARSVAEGLGGSDPGEIVADEWAGQAIVFLGVAAIGSELAFVAMLVGFGLFRLFDILKPWPIRKLEKLPGGVGILADDIAAGLIAMAIMLAMWKLGVLAWLSRYFRFTDELNVFTAAVLGAVQGLTEFLPISSDGHLKLLEWVFGIRREDNSMQLFDLMVHVGTVGSVLVVMRKDIAAWLKRLPKVGQYGITASQVYARSSAVRILVLAIVADIVTVVVYLLMHKLIRTSEDSKWLLAVGWGVSAIFLFMADGARRGRLGLRKFDMTSAAWVGLAQAVAIIPSVSRSGSTICVAILFGLKRRWAVEFSFLAGIPLILGAAAKELFDSRETILAGGVNGVAFGVGMAAACIVGIYALKILMMATRRAKLKYFGYYCLGLAILVSLYLLLSHGFCGKMN